MPDKKNKIEKLFFFKQKKDKKNYNDIEWKIKKLNQIINIFIFKKKFIHQFSRS